MREKLVNITLLVLVMLVLFAIGETAIRIFLPQIGQRPFKDVNLGWATKEYQEFDPLKDGPKTDPRILFIGDSYLAGQGVYRLRQRFPLVFKKKIGKGFNIRILASGRWGTDQEFLAFMQKGKHWNPDLVVLAFCPDNDLANSLSNSHGTKPYFTLDSAGKLLLHDPFGNSTKIGFRHQGGKRLPRSYLIDLVRYAFFTPGKEKKRDFLNVDPRYYMFDRGGERYDEIRALKPTQSWSPQMGSNLVSAYIHEDFEINTYQWKLLDAILSAFNSECERAGVKLLVMLLPTSLKARNLSFVAGGDLVFRFQTPDGPFTFRAAEPRDRLKAICEKRGINFFDPTPGFIDAVRRHNLQEVVWLCDSICHFSPVAHEMLAELLLRHLMENPYLLQPASQTPKRQPGKD